MSGEVPGYERLNRGGGSTSGGSTNTSASTAREPGIGGVVKLRSGSLSHHGFV
jgi:hypothetical protein